MNDLEYIRAVLFDFDGLLIDSEPYWEMAGTELLRRRGKEYTRQLRLSILGRGLRESVEYLQKEFEFTDSIDELIDEWSALMYSFLLPKAKLMEGAEELIYSFHKQGIELAIVTGGHKKEKVIEILKKFGFEKYFPVIVTRDDVRRGKPAPDPFLKAASALGVKSKDCLVFEDSPSGVIAGKAAGMMVYGVNADEEILEKLKDAGADKVFRSLMEIHI